MKPKVIAIAGPTASGKSAAAVACAREFDGEILSMDSMQIYRNMDIGTATPDEKEKQGIVHHLLSYVDPQQPYSVAEYQQDARNCMQDVLSRGKLPIFCGGTGLYLQAVSHPIQFGSGGVSSELRTQFLEMTKTPEGILQLHQRLAQVDPASAARLHPNDTRRVARALEIFETTGVPMSQSAQDWEEESTEDWQVFALSWPRPVLIERIERRVDEMMENGLVDEVNRLLKSGLSPQSQSMQAIGYKEIAAYLLGDCSLKDAVLLVKQRTRQYAKRQMTWLRRDARVQWIQAEEYESAEAIQAAFIKKIREVL